MAKDTAHPPRLEELSDAEIARLEGQLFCYGGPPKALCGRLAAKAAGAPVLRADAAG